MSEKIEIGQVRRLTTKQSIILLLEALQDIYKETVDLVLTRPLDNLAVNRVIKKAQRESGFWIARGNNPLIENNTAYNIRVGLKRPITNEELDELHRTAHNRIRDGMSKN